MRENFFKNPGGGVSNENQCICMLWPSSVSYSPVELP